MTLTDIVNYERDFLAGGIGWMLLIKKTKRRGII